MSQRGCAIAQPLFLWFRFRKCGTSCSVDGLRVTAGFQDLQNLAAAAMVPGTYRVLQGQFIVDIIDDNQPPP